MKYNNGIVWFVDENPSQRRSFYQSYKTAQYHMENISKIVFYTGEVPNVDADKVRLNSDAKTFAAKYEAMKVSPFQKTLFLDNDTFVLKDMTEVIHKTRYVAALPYPNFHRRKDIRCLEHMKLPDSWRNVNSGVVVFEKNFMRDYEKVWNSFSKDVLSLPGKDQCLFSLCLHLNNDKWTPLMNLQLTTTPYAVEFIRRCKDVPKIPSLGRLPYSLIFDSYVLHYTADKEIYYDLLMNTLQIEKICSSAYGISSELDLLQIKQDDLFHGQLFSDFDNKNAIEK